MQTTVASTPHLRRVGGVIACLSVVVIAIATLSPASGSPLPSHLCLICGSRGGVDTILNVLLFVPLGIGLGLLAMRAKLAIPALCALSAVIETTQLFFIPGRDATVGDVLTNTLGGALGFAIARYASIWLRPSPRNAKLLTIGWCGIWLTIQAVSAFGFTPAIPDSQYYGQVARRLGDFELFPGRVISASIAGVAIPNSHFEDSHDAEHALLRDGAIITTVVPGAPTRDIAPIVRVADAEQRGIVLLAQDEGKFLFAVRTGGDVLRLRAPIFALSNVFPPAIPGASMPPTDTITLSGRYAAHEARMNAQTKSRTYDRRIAITASLGWTLVLPFQWFIEGTRTEHVLNWAWIALLLLPLGYWASLVTRHYRLQGARTLSATILPVTLTLLAVGLVLVPGAFAVSAAPLGDWLAALTGVLLGSGLAFSMSEQTAEQLITD
jgi:VanZ family protein